MTIDHLHRPALCCCMAVDLSVVCHSYCFIHLCVREYVSFSACALLLPATICAYFMRSTNGWHLGASCAGWTGVTEAVSVVGSLGCVCPV
jgi:hypothetical protein